MALTAHIKTAFADMINDIEDLAGLLFPRHSSGGGGDPDRFHDLRRAWAGIDSNVPCHGRITGFG